MKHKKLRVAILFGGKSVEHEVSIQSAKSVYKSLDKNKYDVELIGIDKRGVWHPLPEQYLLDASFDKQLLPMSGQALPQKSKDSSIVAVGTTQQVRNFDVVFPVLHGTFGEEGSVQGLLKLANIPFVGSGVLGSAIGMDKDVMKRLLREAGLPVGNFLVYKKGEKISFTEVSKKLGLPLFIKPANLGSSVGVSKVHTEKEFLAAVQDGFQYDTKILIEEYIKARELEISLLGNDNPIVSIPGEIVAHHDFYDYDAKYLDEHGAELKIPANISPQKVKEMQTLAMKAFKVLCLDGMARIDFFFTEDEKLYINEANTLPGFTSISMYPKLWEASGIAYPELIEKLIQLAFEKYTEQKKLKTTV